MIELQFVNNKACTFSAIDWKRLRTEYRIIGESLGDNPNSISLPAFLLHEEVVLLIRKGIAKLLAYPLLQNEPTQSNKAEYDSLQQDLLEKQQTLYRKSRREDVEKIIDKIIEGKRKRGRSTQEESREEIIESELQKCTVTENNMIWPVLKSEIDSIKGASCNVDLENILKLTTNVKCAVYADLWEKGHYITVGHKFGGDFLVYLGDPAVFHATHIVRCVEDEKEPFPPSELVAFGRISSSVKKHAVLASFDNEQVNYITINWDDD